MKSILTHIGIALIACALWGAAIFAALDQGWGHSALAEAGDAAGFEQTARSIAQDKTSGNLSIVMIESAQSVSRFHLSQGEPLDDKAIFQVASLGK